MDNKKYQIGKQILQQSDLEKVITVKDSTFKLKFPNPFEQEKIEREISIRIGGASLDSYPSSMYNMIRMTVTLDHVIVDKPDWFTVAGECYDEELLTELWSKYLEAKEDFRRLLREGKFKRNS